MIEDIKKLIYSKYKPDDKIWLFFSLFDEKWNLLISNWVLTTDKTLDDLIKLLYNWILKKEETKTKHIIIDVITSINEQTDVNAFLQMDPKVNWVILWETKWEKTWLMLPNIKWINTMSQAIAGIKTKYQLQWDVTISTFTVDEIILDR